MTDEALFERPPLEYMCRGYFHQDWDLEGPNAAAVLDSFGSQDSLEQVQGAHDAATELLGRGLSDEELKTEVEAAGLDEYDPEGEGMTHRQWLELVVARLTTWIERRANSDADRTIDDGEEGTGQEPLSARLSHQDDFPEPMTDEAPVQTPALEHLCKAYFHQDWDLEGPHAAAVLDSFGRENPVEDVVGARDAARKLLDYGLSDEDLKTELETIGLDQYYPGYEGMTHRQWLELVVARLTTWIERRA